MIARIRKEHPDKPIILANVDETDWRVSRPLCLRCEPDLFFLFFLSFLLPARARAGAEK